MPTTLARAIALSAGNKGRATNEQGNVIVVQERHEGIFNFWLHLWMIASDCVMEADLTSKEAYKIKTIYNVDPDAKIWFSAESDEDAIDPEKLLSALQTATYELGRDDGVLATSDVLLRQEAQKTLDHLQSVLRQYNRTI